MLHLILAYSKFLFKSTNHHGIHSPFVYEYVTKCIYKKSKLHSNKGVNFVLKNFVYFNPKTIDFKSSCLSIEDHILEDLRPKGTNKTNYEITCWENPKSFYLTSDIISSNPESILLINDIHANPLNSKIWKQIQDQKRVTVTIDFYKYGVVFFRKEQEKQHFVVRL